MRSLASIRQVDCPGFTGAPRQCHLISDIGGDGFCAETSGSISAAELATEAKGDTATVLDAIANGAVLSVLPVDLPLGQ